MTSQLSVLIEKTKAHKMTPKEIQLQRDSLVYRISAEFPSQWELSGAKTQTRVSQSRLTAS